MLHSEALTIHESYKQGCCMIHAYIANASLCNIPFLFLYFLCHPYIFTIFVENVYCSLVYIYILCDSQDYHTEVYNIIRMQMTPKIITIRYIKHYKTLATLKFSTAAYRVVVSTDHIRLNAWPSNYLFTLSID